MEDKYTVTSFNVRQKNHLGLTDYNGVDLELNVYVQVTPGADVWAVIDEVTEKVRDKIKARASDYLPYVVLHKTDSSGLPPVTVTDLFQGKPLLKEE